MFNRRPDPPSAKPGRDEAERRRKHTLRINPTSLAGARPRQQPRQPAPARRSPLGSCLGIFLGVAIIVLFIRFDLVPGTVLEPTIFRSIPLIGPWIAPPPPPLPTRTVTSQGLHLRASPDPSSTVREQLRAGQEVEVLEEAQQPNGSLWARVRVGGKEGWVNSKYLK